MRSDRPGVDEIVHVAHLTRRFGRVLAIDDVSFTVNRGEIIGFLGPNGAGKTTTLRILCGYLAATSGDVIVAGHDVHEEPLEARRHVGYLAERCPLYPEMRVDEFLHFRAALKGVPGRYIRRRVDDVKERCGLTDVGRRLIGHLSKGYAQRVGLADALLHEPDLLILDEPTIGLDPVQIRQTRELIRSVARERTVILSSHILSEVEAICQRVLILNRGRLIAADTTERLRALRHPFRHVRAELSGPPEGIRQRLLEIPGLRVVDLTCDGEWSSVRMEYEGDGDPRPQIFRLASEMGWNVRELCEESGRLEDIFVALTSSASSTPERMQGVGREEGI